MSFYVCNPQYVQGRNGNYKKAKAITAKWRPIRNPKDSNLCGNVRPAFHLTNKKFTFAGDVSKPGFTGMYQVISSALLLYRLFVLWAFTWNICDNEKNQRYKCIWWITLQHKDTGEILMFGEWKGAAGIWTKYHSPKELPKTYKRDLLELMNFLASQEVPHPYDGLVAGSVA